MAYAPSWGRDEFTASSETVKETQYFLKQFTKISVRETSGVKLCRDVFGVEATRVLDPVFLLEPEEYDRLASKSGKQETEGFIFAYLLDVNEEKNKVLKRIAKTLCLKVIKVTDARKVVYQKKEIPDDFETDVSVEDWIYYFRHADYVFTDSHHGLAMAIIFRKQFLCFMNSGRGATRFHSLMELFGMTERLIYQAEDAGKNEILQEVEYDGVVKILNQEKERSLKWLRDALL